MGKPGAGKLILMKHALIMTEQEQSVEKIVLSFFFHGRGISMQKTAHGLYRSLLHQLLSQSAHLLNTFTQIYVEKCASEGPPGDKWEWRENELRKHVYTYVMQVAKTHNTWIYIDALDEDGEESATDLIQFFNSFMPPPGMSNSRYINICFSCRYFPIIAWENGQRIRVDNENTQDIRTYIQNMVDSNIERKDIAADIEDEILRKSSNTFQWVVLVVRKALSLYRRRKALRLIKEDIRKLPLDLEKLYKTLFLDISPEDKLETLRLMQWVCSG